MVIAQTFQIPRGETVRRLSAAMVLATLITFALFFMMHMLTKLPNQHVRPPTPYVPIDMVFEPPGEKTILRPALPERQPPLETPTPSKTKMEPNEDTLIVGTYKPPTVELKGAKPTFGSGIDNSEATPIVRIQPRYPVIAAKDGIEGWVKLIFSIDASGKVFDIEIVDSSPKRIFDREAKRALAKWKYRPMLANNKPVPQTGMQVVLDFTLQQ